MISLRFEMSFCNVKSVRMIVSSYTNAGLGIWAGESDKVIEMFYGRAKFPHAPHYHLTVLGWIPITAETVNYGFDYGGGMMAPFICRWVSMLPARRHRVRTDKPSTAWSLRLLPSLPLLVKIIEWKS